MVGFFYAKYLENFKVISWIGYRYPHLISGGLRTRIFHSPQWDLGYWLFFDQEFIIMLNHTNKVSINIQDMPSLVSGGRQAPTHSLMLS
jgi:ABC-type oligopeptide transport system ATPase subunit